MRRSILILTTGISLSVICCFAVSAQKIMKMDDDLLANSKPMEAKAKGFGTIGKFQFGPYKIVSGKTGWTTTTGKSHLFSPKTESKSKTKLSFVFVKDDKDSVMVSAAMDTDLKELSSDLLPVPMPQGWSTLQESNENFLAELSTRKDTTTWKMMVLGRSGSDVKGNFQFEGILTNGVTELQIKDIKVWADGKNAMMGLIIGYEFYSSGHPVAAVQASVDTFVKKIVWIREDMDDQVKLIIAAASAALMVRAQQSMPK